MFTPSYQIFRESYPENITFSQAAEIVNNHVSTWWKWLKEDAEPVKSFVLGKSRRIRLVDLCKYIDSQISPAPDELIEPVQKTGKPQKVKERSGKGQQRGKKQRFNLTVVAAAASVETPAQHNA